MTCELAYIFSINMQALESLRSLFVQARIQEFGQGGQQSFDLKGGGGQDPKLWANLGFYP